MVRIVPNKFPAFETDAKADQEPPGPNRVVAGYGFHEVLIESPRHDADLASMTDAEIDAVVCAYRERSRHLLRQPGIAAVVLFRDHGPWGASLLHPRTQVVALGFVPPLLGLSADWGKRYY